MAEEVKPGETRPEEPKVEAAKAEQAKPEEAKEGPGCTAIGVIVLFIAIVVAFGLLVGMCGKL